MNINELINIRRHLHANPELGYQEFKTTELITEYLLKYDIRITHEFCETGVVGVISKGTSDRMIGLRADIDALPMQDRSNNPWLSLYPGIAHACGHDGHTAILLGVAQELALNCEFDGTVVLIFQPAEEGLAGARRMIENGLFEMFHCSSIYALHNWPELQVGELMTRPGPIMAAGDIFEIEICGSGGHAAQPHLTQDITLAMGEIVVMLNTVTSRALHPCEPAVITITQVECGSSHNMIPSTARIIGTARMFSPKAQDMLASRIHDVVMKIAESHGAKAHVNYIRCYPATINHTRETLISIDAGIMSGMRIAEAGYPALTSEDFSFMLEKCPGSYVWLGSGPSAPLHHPEFDFNDDAIEHGVRWFLNVVKSELA